MRTIAATALLTIALAQPAAAAGSNGSLTVGGTGGAIALVDHVAEACAASGGPKAVIVASLGSSGALKALGKHALNVALLARPLEPAEMQPDVVVVPLARTLLVFATSHPAPDALRSSDLPNIFASPAPRWRDGAEMRLILRTRQDSDSVLMGRLIPGMNEALETARRRPELPITATDQDNLDLVAQLSGSLVQTGLAQVIAEARPVRLVSIDGVTPSIESLVDGTYPYQKPFYMAHRAGDRDADRLLACIRSPAGREVLRQNGALPLTE